MILFLLFEHILSKPSEIQISDQGYYTLSMSTGSKLYLNLENKVAYMYQDLKPLISVEKNGTLFPVGKSKYITRFPMGQYEITLKNNTNLLFWVLDYDICENNVLYVQTENKVSINMPIPDINGPICFFFQSYFSSAYVVTSIVEDEGLVSEFRDSAEIGKKSKVCENPKKCNFLFNSPFFYRLVGGKNKLLSIKFEVENPESTITQCAFESSNNLLNTSTAQLFCDTYSDDISYYSYAVLVLIAVVILFIVVLQFMFPQLFSSNQMDKRFKNLKKNPYANQLDQPNGEAVA